MMKEIVEERDDLMKANQILQALIGNRDKEIDRLRSLVESLCDDNERLIRRCASVGETLKP